MTACSLTFLGTGTSHGIPVIGCTCPVCTSSDERDTRLRSSVLIEDENHALVIDTGPEFRLQALKHKITHLDAVFYTHDHADHINGIDDLRSFSRNGPLRVYASRKVVETIRVRFPYALDCDIVAGGRPHLLLTVIQPYETVTVGTMNVTALPILHGGDEIFAYRIGSLGYVTDCSEVPQKSVEYLRGLDTLVVDALRRFPHPSHFSLFEALGLISHVGPKHAYLTHLSHGFAHQELEEELPPSVHVAYDGLVIPIGGENEKEKKLYH
ncbi:MAG TPA: MBL fold metallo-hydrolase [Sphaerochaeta sp.]|nr:MBL fold metallo-hydrolase [Sphaerochaeta sp.]